ncbi:MAG TPA: hypothetical protein PK887_05275 [Ignavibacteriales bacterium]|nr:hypothetical protein [Ignavibacteriales bacterium]
MRIVFCIFAFTMILFAQEQIINFQQLMNSLKKGKEIKAVIDYSKCVLVLDGKDTVAAKNVPRAIGGMEFKSWEFFDTMVVKNKNAYVATSESVLINHPKYGYIINYVKLKVKDDNKVEVMVKYLDNYREVVDEVFYTIINDKKNNGGLSLFEK